MCPLLTKTYNIHCQGTDSSGSDPFKKQGHLKQLFIYHCCIAREVMQARECLLTLFEFSQKDKKPFCLKGLEQDLAFWQYICSMET